MSPHVVCRVCNVAGHIATQCPLARGRGSNGRGAITTVTTATVSSRNAPAANYMYYVDPDSGRIAAALPTQNFGVAYYGHGGQGYMPMGPGGAGYPHYMMAMGMPGNAPAMIPVYAPRGAAGTGVAAEMASSEATEPNNGGSGGHDDVEGGEMPMHAAVYPYYDASGMAFFPTSPVLSSATTPMSSAGASPYLMSADTMNMSSVLLMDSLTLDGPDGAALALPPPPLQPPSGSDGCTLWMGSLAPWMTDKFVALLFHDYLGERVSVRVMLDSRGLPAGYGFVRFLTHAGARRALESLHGTPITGTDRAFQLNWAVRRPSAGNFTRSGGSRSPPSQDVTDGSASATAAAADEGTTNNGAADPTGVDAAAAKLASQVSADAPAAADGGSDAQPGGASTNGEAGVPAGTRGSGPRPLAERSENGKTVWTVFVGNIGPDVTEMMLLETFHKRYPTVVSARLAVHPATFAHQGFGFVSFSDYAAAHSTLSDMQGELCGSRPLRISSARPRR